MSVRVTTLDEVTRPPLSADSPLATQEYFINMGPQHPATHGVLRLVLRLDGETVREVIPVLGYVHRSIEKIAEHQTYRQIVHLTDRLDYLSCLTNNWCISRTVEQAAGIETSPRIEHIRTLMAELQRLQSHTLWWGVLGMDLGAFTPFLYGFRDREGLTEILEQTIGARLTMNYIQPGGLMCDIHPELVPRVKAWITGFRPHLEEYEQLVSGNLIVHERLVGVGVLSAERAVALGSSGPVLRASGVPWDLRKLRPYGVYDRLDFDVAVGSVGDCWDRYHVRLEELRQSLSMVEQLLDTIPEGPTMTLKPAAKIRLPEGRWYGEMETARGILGVQIVSDGKEQPWRLHLRTPNFHNLWCLTEIAPGWRVADLVAMASTLDLVVPDIDR